MRAMHSRCRLRWGRSFPLHRRAVSAPSPPALRCFSDTALDD